MTLNDLERRNSPRFAFFPLNSIALPTNYAIVVEDRPIMPVDIISQFQSFMLGTTNPPCDSGASCYLSCTYHVFFPFLLCCNASAFVICAIKNYLLTYLLTYCLSTKKLPLRGLLIFCQNAASLQTFILSRARCLHYSRLAPLN